MSIKENENNDELLFNSELFNKKDNLDKICCNDSNNFLVNKKDGYICKNVIKSYLI